MNAQMSNDDVHKYDHTNQLFYRNEIVIPGFEGYYNYFNIGSYGNGTATIINNGLSYAQSKGWSSIRASIFGGAEVVKDSYIIRYSQNTLY